MDDMIKLDVLKLMYKNNENYVYAEGTLPYYSLAVYDMFGEDYNIAHIENEYIYFDTEEDALAFKLSVDLSEHTDEIWTKVWDEEAKERLEEVSRYFTQTLKEKLNAKS
jgi:hypothetical protein